MRPRSRRGCIMPCIEASRSDHAVAVVHGAIEQSDAGRACTVSWARVAVGAAITGRLVAMAASQSSGCVCSRRRACGAALRLVSETTKTAAPRGVALWPLRRCAGLVCPGLGWPRRSLAGR